MKIDLLAIGVHPDDVELSCCGTILKHLSLGKTAGLLDLTRGELGSRGTADIRDKEAADSASIMGVSFRENLRMADGFFQYTQDNLLKIVAVIRKYQPEIVLANSIDDRHPDHGRAAKLCADACFYSGLKRIETKDAAGNPQEHWRPKAVYHYIQDKRIEPDFVVDITGFMDKKLECMQAFSSQFFNPKVAGYEDEPQTPISGEAFFEYIRASGRVFGRPLGVEFAEGFTTNRTLGVGNLFHLK